MLKTLAGKHRSSVSKMAARYRPRSTPPHGLRTCLRSQCRARGQAKPLVARFGGIPLKRQKTAVLTDVSQPAPTTPTKSWSGGSWR